MIQLLQNVLRTKIVGIMTLVATASIVAAISLAVPARGIEILVLDFKQRLSFRLPTSKDVAVVALPSREELQGHLFAFTRDTVIDSLAKIHQASPKIIVLLLDDKYWGSPPVAETELIAFRKKLETFPELYIYGNGDERYLGDKKIFGDFPRIFIDDMKAIDGNLFAPADNKVRRIVTYFHSSKQYTAAPAFLRDELGYKIDFEDFKYSFDYMDTQQIYMKYFPPATFTVDGGQTVDYKTLKGKIVLAGFEDLYNGGFALTPVSSIWKSGRGTGPSGVRVMSDTELLAHTFTNLISNEYVRIAPVWIGWTYTACFCLLLAYFCFSIRRPQDVVWATTTVVLGNMVPFVAFFAGDWFLPSVPVFISSLILTYVCLPVTLFKVIQNRTTERLATKQKAEKLKHEAQIAVRSAEADASFRLATRVAHDIRSPLSALQILSSTIQIDSAKSRLMNRSIERLEQISSSLLRSYRELGKFGDRQAPVCRIKPIVTSIEEHCKKIFPEITLILTDHSGVEYLSCSAVELERHLFNLVTNSIEALKASCTDDPTIRLEVFHENGIVKIRIADNGPGIAPVIKPSLFQEGATYGKVSGTGLGLASAKTFFSAHNGSITLEETNTGASFLIEITPQSISEVVKVQGFLIIVDDDTDILNLLSNQISELNEKLVTTAPDNALAKIRELVIANAPFTIVCDLVFQGSDILGFDLLNDIPETSQTYVSKILYTTLADETQIQEICRKAGIRLIDKKVVPRLQT